MTYEDYRDEYRRLWTTAMYTERFESASKITAKKILAGKIRYEAIERATGVPWYVVGLIHAMESGCQFGTHLHNGDSLARRTVSVPRGRPLSGKPPFTWEESAIDAIQYDKLNQVQDWPLERILWELECYNGLGHRKYHKDILTPYLWSGTHWGLKPGKYTSDGKWSATAVSGQCGAVILLKRLIEIDSSIELHYDEPSATVQVPEVAETVPESFPKADPAVVTEAVKQSWTIRGAGVGLVGMVATAFDETVKSLMDAAAHIAQWTPATGVLASLGANMKQIGFGLAVAGLAIVVARRLGAAKQGKIG